MKTACGFCKGTGEDLIAGPAMNVLDYLPCKPCDGTGWEPELTEDQKKIADLEVVIDLLKGEIARLSGEIQKLNTFIENMTLEG